MAKKRKKPGPKLAKEADRKVVVSASLPKSLAQRLDRWRKTAGLNRSEAIARAVEQLVAR